MYRGAVVCAAYLLVFPADGLAAKAWELRKTRMGSVCNVQPAGSQPQLGDLVSEHDTRKEACTAARQRYDDGMSDASKCWTYTPLAVDSCKLDGIKLPKAAKKPAKRKAAASSNAPASR
jgi:hypothetical protein